MGAGMESGFVREGEHLRVLVLTSSTGSGHDRRAEALKAWVATGGHPDLEVRVEHLLEKSSWVLRFGVWVYNTIQRYAPYLHNIYWYIVELFGFGMGFTYIAGVTLVSMLPAFFIAEPRLN